MNNKKKMSQPANRRHVVEVAAQLFLIGGYTYTSMDEVMRESKVSKSNIYYHFKSKDDLLFAVVEYWVKQYESTLFYFLSQNEQTVEERIFAFLDSLCKGISERNYQGGCPFITLYIQCPEHAEQVKSRISRFFIELQPLIAKLFEQGIQKNEFRTTIQPEQAASLFITSMEGALMLAETRHDVSVIMETAHNFFNMLR